MAVIQERTAKDGTRKFLATIRLKGFPTQCATFTRKTDAKLWVQQTEAAIREGRHFKTSEAKKRTLSELIGRYVEQVLPRYSTKEQGERKHYLKWWDETVGYQIVADLTPVRLAELRDKLTRIPSPSGKLRGTSTVRRFMLALSHVLSVACEEWGWINENPLKNVRMPAASRGRVRYLSVEERGRLLDACKASQCRLLYPFVLLALCTGARFSELRFLRWQDVDFAHRMIRLEETKNGERRSLPLSPQACNVLQELRKVPRLDSHYVFPGRDGSKAVTIKKYWERAVKDAGLEDFRFHDLRHTTASYLAMSGATLPEISAILGHKTMQMVKRYAHLSEQHTLTVVERMAGRFLK